LTLAEAFPRNRPGESLLGPGVGDPTDPGDTGQVERVLAAALWLLDGFGSPANRFLHDITAGAVVIANNDAALAARASTAHQPALT